MVERLVDRSRESMDEALLETSLRPTALEQIESLEQLRALAYGYKIYVAQVEETSVEVDTAADLESAERYLSRLN